MKDHVRGCVAGRLVDLPGAQIGVDDHAGQQVAIRKHDLDDAHPGALARRLVLAQGLLGHAALASHLDPPLEGTLRVLRRARHVRVVRVHPELAARRLEDRRRQAVVVRVGVGADQETDVLELEAGLVERLLEPAEAAGLRQPGVH